MLFHCLRPAECVCGVTSHPHQVPQLRASLVEDLQAAAAEAEAAAAAAAAAAEDGDEEMVGPEQEQLAQLAQLQDMLADEAAAAAGGGGDGGGQGRQARGQGQQAPAGIAALGRRGGPRRQQRAAGNGG